MLEELRYMCMIIIVITCKSMQKEGLSSAIGRRSHREKKAEGSLSIPVSWHGGGGGWSMIWLHDCLVIQTCVHCMFAG